MRSRATLHPAARFTGHLLSIVGALGLFVSSFHMFDTLVFYWPYDRLRLLRLALMFTLSIACVALGASLFHTRHWWRDFARGIPLYVLGLGSVGLISYIGAVYTHRRPGFITSYETRWLILGVIGFVGSLFIGRLHTKRSQRKA